MGEGGTPVTVTGSMSHGLQTLVNTTPPPQWSAVEHFSERHRCQLIQGNTREAFVVI